MCLDRVDAERVPTTRSEKVTLEEAGLGEKSISFPDLECDHKAFHSTVLETFPKLREGGGYEMLRCKPASRDLVLMGPRVSSTPKLLKRRVGNGKVYIRPLQRNLSLEALDEEDDEVKVVST